MTRQRTTTPTRSAVPSDVHRVRRAWLRAAACGAAAASVPALSRAQSDVLRIGHLTPLTGFLGPMGEYGVLGIRLAVEQINAAGGVAGRRLELVSEDSVNPATASTKAQRMYERDQVPVIIGEINSASGLAISQVAARNRRLFINTGGNSDALRGKDCNRYMFHVEAANSMYVKACGQALAAQGLVKGRKWFMLTADYAFGHDLARVARQYLEAGGGTLAGEERVPTDATDFSPFLLKARQARPDVVISNLAGTQITNFMKQYSELGLPYKVAGFGFDTVAAWGAGQDNFIGTWPCIWYHTLPHEGSRRFVDAFMARHGRPPENQAWGDYVALQITAAAMNQARSSDPQQIAQIFEKGTEFDVLKDRPAHFRDRDHQLLQSMYTISPKTGSKPGDRWDFLETGPAVPAAGQPLDVIAPGRDENVCTMG